jgi:hypothetical protein
MREVRELAHQKNRQISQIVNDLLLEGLANRRARPPQNVTLPKFHMGEPRVNLSDRDALEALMKE